MRFSFYKVIGYLLALGGILFYLGLRFKNAEMTDPQFLLSYWWVLLLSLSSFFGGAVLVGYAKIRTQK